MNILGLASVVMAGDNEDFLRCHNIYRCMHESWPAEWHIPALENAQKWAKHQVTANDGQKSPVSGHSVGMTEILLKTSASPVEICDMFYEERDSCSSADSCEFNNFTQMVWNFIGVGCAREKSGDSYWVVCNYAPGGNFKRKEGLNFKPKAIKTKEECTCRFNSDGSPKDAKNPIHADVGCSPGGTSEGKPDAGISEGKPGAGTENKPGGDDAGMSKGAIIGLAVGAIICLMITAVGLWTMSTKQSGSPPANQQFHGKLRHGLHKKPRPHC